MYYLTTTKFASGQLEPKEETVVIDDGLAMVNALVKTGWEVIRTNEYGWWLEKGEESIVIEVV